jgi:hypothetical protein
MISGISRSGPFNGRMDEQELARIDAISKVNVISKRKAFLRQNVDHGHCDLL